MTRAALVRLAGLAAVTAGLLLPAFSVCGWACGRYPLLSLNGQTAVHFAHLPPAAASAVEAAFVLLAAGLLGAALTTVFRTVPAGLAAAELAVALLSLAAVVSVDAVATVRLHLACAACDEPSGGPLLPHVLVAPLGYLVVATGAALGLKSGAAPDRTGHPT